jgi:hypothetical protein
LTPAVAGDIDQAKNIDASRLLCWFDRDRVDRILGGAARRAAFTMVFDAGCCVAV